MRLSNQAIGAVMMALQKGIMEQSDVTVMLKEFNIVESVDGLLVTNPPSVKAEVNSKKTTTKNKVAAKKTTPKKRKTKKTVLNESGELEEVK
jgi:hypothetical protein